MRDKKERQSIEEFLFQVDKLFPVPLSKKQDLKQFAAKLQEKATLCKVTDDGKILAMVAGYTANVIQNMAYISIVASLPEAQGRGYASKLIEEFIQISKEKQLDAVHLYTAATNKNAIRMYEKLGFEPWHPEGEQRPDDIHFIYRIS